MATAATQSAPNNSTEASTANTNMNNFFAPSELDEEFDDPSIVDVSAKVKLKILFCIFIISKPKY